MHKTSSIYVVLFKEDIYVFWTFAFYSLPWNIPFLRFREEADSWWSQMWEFFPFTWLKQLPFTRTETSYEKQQGLSMLCQTVAKGVYSWKHYNL